jgi:inhibitor of KinA sporulation pathway (predicted exonuclease)
MVLLVADMQDLKANPDREAKGIVIESMEPIFDNWVDAQLTFGEKMDSPKTYKLSEALIIADINYDNGEHDALVDARNTAQLFIKMETESELKLSPYYSTEAKVSTYNPFAVLLASYNLAG